ncbi:hypothetical protein BDN70DRAFT_893924 [Pholiota conissans]|uniref:Transmembrane protein n=1 Tax=Pholiota conissans TaxID=109636 RepID=A0A9P5Z465_9AGAR|nr:hypothetical protein BDN70DRAFT_893924 [Pholiota conissans]
MHRTFFWGNLTFETVIGVVHCVVFGRLVDNWRNWRALTKSEDENKEYMPEQVDDHLDSESDAQHAVGKARIFKWTGRDAKEKIMQQVELRGGLNTQCVFDSSILSFTYTYVCLNRVITTYSCCGTSEEGFGGGVASLLGYMFAWGLVRSSWCTVVYGGFFVCISLLLSLFRLVPIRND